jgi:hypothetical protein
LGKNLAPVVSFMGGADLTHINQITRVMGSSMMKQWDRGRGIWDIEVNEKIKKIEKTVAGIGLTINDR